MSYLELVTECEQCGGMARLGGDGEHIRRRNENAWEKCPGSGGSRVRVEPSYNKSATQLEDSDGNQAWVVTVIVDGPGDYVVVAMGGTDE